MKLTPTRPVTLKTPSGPREYKPGQIFEAPEDKARPFIERGLIRPVEECPDDPLHLHPKSIVIRIRSKVLGEDVWLASNVTARDHLKCEGLAVYLPEEIRHLKGLSKDNLRAINEAKKVFEKARVVRTDNPSEEI